MALSKKIEKKIEGFDGVLTADAYCKVSRISGDKSIVDFEVSEIVGTKYIGISNYSFAPSLDGDNFIAQAYAYLKTLPEFADAVDC